MINVNTIKRELKALDLNPKDFFVYNDGVTIVVADDGIFVNCAEERKMHSGTEEGRAIMERVKDAREVTENVYGKIKRRFDCQMEGHSIHVKRTISTT